VTIITLNEEKNIERCMKSVLDLADEIIVVDSGSEDQTEAVASRLGARVVFHPWENYSDQKNYAASLAGADYVLSLDADEEVSATLRASMEEVLHGGVLQGCELNRKTFYLGKFLEHTWYPEWRLRCFMRGNARFEGGLHERIICQGKIARLKGDLYHYSYRSLKDQMLRLVRYADQSAVLMEQEGRSFHYVNLVFNPCWAFCKVLILGGWRDGYRGFLIAAFESVYTFLKYAFFLERTMARRNPRS
jgi:glycosyltransferase involved in cell wall biosynthesis